MNYLFVISTYNSYFLICNTKQTAVEPFIVYTLMLQALFNRLHSTPTKSSQSRLGASVLEIPVAKPTPGTHKPSHPQNQPENLAPQGDDMLSIAKPQLPMVC